MFTNSEAHKSFKEQAQVRIKMIDETYSNSNNDSNNSNKS